MKNPRGNRIILWSGGLDSTYLIQKSIEDGWHVDAYYFRIVNNNVKSKMELTAIDKIRTHFDINNFQYKGIITEITIKSTNDYRLIFSQLPVWLFSMLYTISQYGYDKHVKEEICLGYVMNDDAISFLNDIRYIWNSYSSVIHNRELPKLVFPLSKIKKDEIINLITPELIQLTLTC